MVLRRPDPDPLMDVPGVSDSALALRALTLAPGMRAGIADDELDSLVFVSAGSGLLVVGDEALTAPSPTTQGSCLQAKRQSSRQRVRSRPWC